MSSYPDGPILWRRYFGTVWPQEEFLVAFPAQSIADVDGDGKKEVLAVVGREHWDLKAYDGMTGAEKFSLPIDNQGATVFDFDGDGTAEIAVNREGALVIGSVRDGTWLDRAHLGGYRLWQTGVPVAPQREGEPYRIEQRPVELGSQAAAGLGTAAGRSGAKKAGPHGRVVTLGEAEGRPASLGLLRAKAGEPFTVTELPLDGAHSDLGTMQVLAATTDRLIVSTRDGRVRVMSANGHSEASWACGDPFVSRPAVADIDGDGANELVVCRAGGKVAAMRVGRAGRREGSLGSGWLRADDIASIPLPHSVDCRRTR